MKDNGEYKNRFRKSKVSVYY